MLIRCSVEKFPLWSVAQKFTGFFSKYAKKKINKNKLLLLKKKNHSVMEKEIWFFSVSHYHILKEDLIWSQGIPENVTKITYDKTILSVTFISKTIDKGVYNLIKCY